MGVRLKIFLFTLLMFLLFGLCVAAYFVLFAPSFEMRRQYDLFGEAAAATGNLETEANRLLYNDVIIQRPKFEAAAERYASSRTAMGTVLALKPGNAVFADSIAAVGHLFDQNEALIAEVDEELSGLAESLAGPAPDNGWTLDALLFGGASGLGASGAGAAARRLAADVHVLAEYLISSRQSVEQRSRAVYQEIGRIEGRTKLRIGLIVAAAVLVSLALALRIAATIIDQNERSKEDLKRSRNEVMESAERLRAANAELGESLARLGLAQDKLVVQEKLSALGQLAAGIAHELNSPLGAIVSANGSVDRYLSEGVGTMVGFIGELDEPERAALAAVLAAAGSRTETTDFGPGAAEIRSAAAALEARGLPSGGPLAELAAERDFAGLIETMPGLFAMPRAARLLSFARDLFAARRMAGIVALAAGQAADVVGALRQYLSGDADDEFRAVDVERSLDMVLTLLQNKLKYGIRIERDFRGAPVFGSERQLWQVWMNLIGNAAYAMNRQGTLSLSTRIEGDRLQVVVADDGPGIPPEIRDRIFEPFFTTKRLGEGLGLGLDICRRIVQAHKGTIDFTSVPGDTRFTVSLPLSGAGGGAGGGPGGESV